jgi:hippurate hydrolase
VHLLKGIERVAKAAAAAAGAPEPEIVKTPEFTPATFNDPELTRATVEVLAAVFGKEDVLAQLAMMGGEDFSQYGRAGVPCVMFRLGTIDPAKATAAKEGKIQLPSLHSDMYAPVPAPSIQTGSQLLTASVLRILGK